MASVSTDGQTIDKDRGERWARKPKKILRLSALSAAVPEAQRPRRPSTFFLKASEFLHPTHARARTSNTGSVEVLASDVSSMPLDRAANSLGAMPIKPLSRKSQNHT
jgi:hypothetical protein